MSSQSVSTLRFSQGIIACPLKGVAECGIHQYACWVEQEVVIYLNPLADIRIQATLILTPRLTHPSLIYQDLMFLFTNHILHLFYVTRISERE